MANNSSYVFNAQVIQIDYAINNGAYKTVTGTDASTNWVPSSSTVAFTPLTPTRGNLQWEKNTIAFMPTQGSSEAQSLTFFIDKTVNPQAQMQIYLFWKDSTDFAVQVLVNGQLIFSGNQAQAVAVKP